VQLQYGVSLQSFNTFRIEARAARFATIGEVADLRELFEAGDWNQAGRLVLGGGSNLLITRDLDELVLHMALCGRELVGEDHDAWYVRAGAGESWDGFVEWTLDHGYAGLENLIRIPGSVGAAPIQNIGAYGIELTERVHQVEVFDASSGQTRALARDECAFAYRDSIFKHELRGAIVTSVTFRLPKRWTAVVHYGELQAALSHAAEALTPRRVADEVARIRGAKLPDPRSIGNAGSFFKNPVIERAQRDSLVARFPSIVNYPEEQGRFKLAAAWMIEQCGWKGRAMGRAAVHERQALVLVNRGDATGAEILDLSRAIAESVRERFEVQLEAELVVL
jgi:UDP-N-acetylmuramate dehydrogenase